jgi:hypothetical protein
MTKVDDYRTRLRNLKQWEPLLIKESGLPGPRGNLELAQAFALEADLRQIDSLLSIPTERAPENTPQAFLVFCGVSALGRHIAGGDPIRLAALRGYASDSRWRIREAVAMALQYLGDADVKALLREARKWGRGNWLEKRAAAAGICEPRLLREAASATAVLKILDAITASMVGVQERNTEPFRILRQGMGYCWSVAVAALPAAGKPLMEKWIRSTDPDIRWIMKENLRKARLARLDAAWVRSKLAHLAR